VSAARWVLVCEPGGARVRQVLAAIDGDLDLVAIAIGPRTKVEATLTGALAEGAAHCVGIVDEVAIDSELRARRIASALADIPPCPVLVAAAATDDELAPLLAAQLGYAQLCWVAGLRIRGEDIEALRAPGGSWFQIPRRTVLSVVPGNPPLGAPAEPRSGDISWHDAEISRPAAATASPRPIATPCAPRRALQLDSAEDLIATLDRRHPGLLAPGKPR
jgi:hypothetical protein